MPSSGLEGRASWTWERSRGDAAAPAWRSMRPARSRAGASPCRAPPTRCGGPTAALETWKAGRQQPSFYRASPQESQSSERFEPCHKGGEVEHARHINIIEVLGEGFLNRPLVQVNLPGKDASHFLHEFSDLEGIRLGAETQEGRTTTHDSAIFQHATEFRGTRSKPHGVLDIHDQHRVDAFVPEGEILEGPVQEL